MKITNRNELRKVAQERNIAGRSKMTAEELREAVRIAVRSAPSPLSNSARVSNYQRQNGYGRPLTARQVRRINHNTHTASINEYTERTF